MTAEAAYQELMRRVREQALLDSCAAVLSWDEETCMPPGGVEHRGSQMALLAGLSHERATHPRLGKLLAEVEQSSLITDPFCPAAVNVRELRRLYDRATRLPRSLVEELARTVSLAQQAWMEAHRDADFKRFRPWLEKVIALKLREAECLGDGPAYDALLDEYEPGARADDLAILFETLRSELVPLLNTLTYAARTPDVAVLHRPYPVDRQRQLAEEAAQTVGFDFRRGRLDTATHPFFASIGPGDCRITTRYDLHNFSNAFFATLHETGHGVYEQGLPPEYAGEPIGEAPSLGLHEGMARLYENAIARSRSFWQHFYPKVRKAFPAATHGIKVDAFHFAVNHVEAGCNRVGADEISYNLHIIVRFELERALLAGDLQAGDLPGAWNEAYQHQLGVRPPDDGAGCLQDSHWASGMFGYFPSYTLGNVLAAQLFAQAAEDLGDVDRQFARGEFAPLLEWLTKHVFREGSRYRMAALIERLTGSPPDPRCLIGYLHRKYGELYGC